MRNSVFHSKGIIASVLIVPVILSACTPSLGLLNPKWKGGGENPWQGPAVQVLLNHITCRLIADYALNDSQGSPWRYLSKYHFVAAIQLNLQVVNSEAFNPSLSYITPLNADGSSFSKVITNTSNGTVTSSTFNRSLAVAGQINGSQTNSKTITYQLDMQRIATAALAFEKKNIQNENDEILLDPNSDEDDLARAAWLEIRADNAMKDFGGLTDWCGKRSQDGISQSLKGDLLQGDLGLASEIEDGLNAMIAVQEFNIYGNSGPTNAADVKQVAPRLTQEQISDAKQAAADRKAAKEEAAGGRQSTASVTEVVVTGSRTPGPASKPEGSAPQAGSASSPSSFSSVVTFNVVAGMSGGPNWTLLLFKGPSSSGGGGGAGSSSAGGGSSGGGGQLMNYSRTSTDSLTVTFAPTCKTNFEREVITSAFAGSDVTPDNFSISFKVQAKPKWIREDNSPSYDGYFTFAAGDTIQQSPSVPSPPQPSILGVPPSPSAPAASPPPVSPKVGSANGMLVFTGDNGQVLGEGSIAWSYFTLPSGQAQLTGVVTDVQTQAVVGSLVLRGILGKPVFTGLMTDDVETKLTRHGPTQSYWETIPGCDIATGPYIQGVVGGAAATTQNLTLQSRLAPF